MIDDLVAGTADNEVICHLSRVRTSDSVGFVQFDRLVKFGEAMPWRYSLAAFEFFIRKIEGKRYVVHLRKGVSDRERWSFGPNTE